MRLRRWRDEVGNGLRRLADAIDSGREQVGSTDRATGRGVPSTSRSGPDVRHGAFDLDGAPEVWAARVRDAGTGYGPRIVGTGSFGWASVPQASSTGTGSGPGAGSASGSSSREQLRPEDPQPKAYPRLGERGTEAEARRPRTAPSPGNAEGPEQPPGRDRQRASRARLVLPWSDPAPFTSSALGRPERPSHAGAGQVPHGSVQRLDPAVGSGAREQPATRPRGPRLVLPGAERSGRRRSAGSTGSPPQNGPEDRAAVREPATGAVYPSPDETDRRGLRRGAQIVLPSMPPRRAGARVEAGGDSVAGGAAGQDGELSGFVGASDRVPAAPPGSSWSAAAEPSPAAEAPARNRPGTRTPQLVITSTPPERWELSEPSPTLPDVWPQLPARPVAPEPPSIPVERAMALAVRLAQEQAAV